MKREKKGKKEGRRQRGDKERKTGKEVKRKDEEEIKRGRGSRDAGRERVM